MTPDTEQLRTLRRLDGVLGELEGLCEKHEARGRDASERDRRSFQQLRDEASELYGVSPTLYLEPTSPTLLRHVTPRYRS